MVLDWVEPDEPGPAGSPQRNGTARAITWKLEVMETMLRASLERLEG